MQEDAVLNWTGREATEYFLKFQHHSEKLFLYFNVQSARKRNPYDVICVPKCKVRISARTCCSILRSSLDNDGRSINVLILIFGASTAACQSTPENRFMHFICANICYMGCYLF